MENIKLNTLNHEELLTLNDKIKEMISFLEKEIEDNTEKTEEV